MSSPSTTPLPIRALAARWPRVALDLAWCCGFVGLFAVMMVQTPATLSTMAGGGAVQLALVEGAQRQALFKGQRRLATVLWDARRTKVGWRVTHQFLTGPDPSSTGKSDVAVRTVLRLRRDLSLAGLVLEADIDRLARLSGGMSGLLLSGLKGLGRVVVRGDCSLETGECQLRGKIGGHRIDHSVAAGRGPVVTSAIYPLLARGSLGGKAELRVFDPLSLSQRLMEFRIEGRERIRLRSGRFDALRVARDLEGLVTRVWIDSKGRVLKEELPMGLVVEHEAWLGGGERHR